MPKTKKRTKSGVKLILAGTLLLVIFGIWRIHEVRLLAFNSRFAATVPTGRRPTRISLPKVKIDLAVTEATVTDGSWEISPDGASHWDNSANPGQPGNIVIYGHNKTNLFGPIRWLELDDEIVLTDDQNQKYHYRIVNTVIVSPNDIAYLLPTEEETLTLYTCTGFWDSQRYLVIAQPI